MVNKTYRLYPKAIEDLESIYLYSLQEFGVKRTEDYILAIQSSFQHLANDPLISRKCDFIRQDLRAFKDMESWDVNVTTPIDKHLNTM